MSLPTIAEGVVPPITLRGYLRSIAHYPRPARRAAVAIVLLSMASPNALAAVFPFVLAPAAAETGGSVTGLLGVFGASMIVGAVILPVAGRLVDRFGVRRVGLPGILVYALTLVGIGLAATSMPALIALLLLNTVAGGVGILSGVYKLVPEWFGQHQGMAYSILINGATSLAGATLAPMTVLLTQQLGWRSVYLLLGLLVLLVVTPLVAWLMHEPDYVRLALKAPAGPPDALPGFSAKHAILSRPWITTIIAITVGVAAIMAIRQNAVAIFGPTGFSEATIALALSTLLVASVFGQILCGMLLDHTTSPRIASVFVFALAVGIGAILVISGSTPLLFAAAILMGLASGAEATFAPLTVGRYFGLRAYGQVQGLGMAIATVAAATAPVLVAAIGAAAGDFTAPLVVMTIAALLAGILTLTLPNYAEYARRRGY